MLTDRSPFPRPIICHWPRRWPSHPSASDGMMGHVKGLLVSPHFCQPNSIEFDDALKWRLFRAQEGLLRQELREDHVLQLVEVLRWGCKVKPTTHLALQGCCSSHLLACFSFVESRDCTAGLFSVKE